MDLTHVTGRDFQVDHLTSGYSWICLTQLFVWKMFKQPINLVLIGFLYFIAFPLVFVDTITSFPGTCAVMPVAVMASVDFAAVTLYVLCLLMFRELFLSHVTDMKTAEAACSVPLDREMISEQLLVCILQLNICC